ncbi:MAG: ABC transporter permease [Christensenellales bacterium]
MGKKRLGQFLALLFWLMVWQAVASLVALPVLMPGPGQTLTALWHMAGQGTFWLSVGASLLRISAGYLAALLLGVILAVLCAGSAFFQILLSPLRTLIRSTPVSSFIILVLLWLRIDRVPIFITTLTVFPIIWINVQQGISQVDPRLLEMAQVYTFRPSRLYRFIYLPSVLPYFSSAAATGLGFAWKAGIAAEVIAKPLYSIGKNLQDAKVYLDTDALFAWTLVVVLLSLTLETLLKRLVKARGKGDSR